MIDICEFNGSVGKMGWGAVIMSVNGVNKWSQHTAVWGPLALCKGGGVIWAYLSQKVLDPVADR